MNEKTFFNAVSRGEEDILSAFLNLLEKLQVDYCVIGGLAVNAYVEPIVSLDLDIIIAIKEIDRFLAELPENYKIKEFPHSTNIYAPKSDLRIQIQRDEVYQKFIENAEKGNILGYEMKVASVKNTLYGKSLAYADTSRRASKRQKDFADILRIIESYPELLPTLSDDLQKKINELI